MKIQYTKSTQTDQEEQRPFINPQLQKKTEVKGFEPSFHEWNERLGVWEQFDSYPGPFEVAPPEADLELEILEELEAEGNQREKTGPQ